MRFSLLAIATFGLLSTVGCSADSEGAAETQAEAITTIETTRYAAQLEVDGTKYEVQLDLATKLPNEIVQFIPCSRPYGSDKHTCSFQHQAPTNPIASTLRLVADGGAVMKEAASSLHRFDLEEMDPADSAGYFRNPGAAPRLEVDDLYWHELGLAVSTPSGGRLSLPNDEYAHHGEYLRIPYKMKFEPSSAAADYTEWETAPTASFAGLNTWLKFTGKLAIVFPDKITMYATFDKEAHSIAPSKRIRVVLRRVR